MVFIGAAQQNRLFEAARQHLGSSGETMVRDVARQTFNLPMDQITYAQLAALLQTIAREAPAQLGRGPATELATALRRLREEIESSLTTRLIAAAAKLMGPAAQPFLETVCSNHDLLLATIDKSDLLTIAQAVKHHATILLGDEVAQGLAMAVLESGSVKPAEIAPMILALAAEYLGAEGEALVRSLCRRRLEVEIEEIEGEGVSQLARIVEEEVPTHIAVARAAAFVAAARKSTTSPADGLRRKIVGLATDAVGPAAPDFVRTACARAGMPFEAVEHEHLMWLTEVLRGEAVPIVGKKAADELARGVRGLLTGHA
jgi:hypothetical protein